MEELQIYLMQKISIKPKAWRLSETREKGRYNLEATYNPKVSKAKDWGVILTRRGEIKLYHSASAALEDIRKVQPEGAILIVDYRKHE